VPDGGKSNAGHPVIPLAKSPAKSPRDRNLTDKTEAWDSGEGETRFKSQPQTGRATRAVGQNKTEARTPDLRRDVDRAAKCTRKINSEGEGDGNRATIWPRSVTRPRRWEGRLYFGVHSADPRSLRDHVVVRVARVRAPRKMPVKTASEPNERSHEDYASSISPALFTLITRAPTRVSSSWVMVGPCTTNIGPGGNAIAQLRV